MHKHSSYCLPKCSIFVMVLVVLVSQSLLASKGGNDEKQRKGVVLKVNGIELKKSYLSPLSLVNNGATYKGTLQSSLPPHMPTAPGAPVIQPGSIITYQKGNTIYIYPVRQPSLLERFRKPGK